ncbi:BPIB3 protein, partial [Casuarius casuarius]|nr:BPIB3 protein [Casuarius casuarius]
AKMSKFWAVFLLCGLLTPSQGLLGNIPLISRVDKDAVENAITGSLAKDNVFQGLLGGLVGGDQLSSLVGGLLGGEGLVGGGGRGGGLLGKQGLLSAVQGLTGLKIVNITLPKITLRFLPGIGLQLNLYTQLTIDGGSAAGGLLRAQVKANVTARARLVQDAAGAVKLVIEDCKTLLGDISIRHRRWMLHVPVIKRGRIRVSESLGESDRLLPLQLCPVVNTVLGTLNSLLGTVTSVLPLGALGNLQYTLGSLPIISDKSIQLDLNLLVRDAEGNVVDQDPGQAVAVPLPLAASGVSQLGIPQAALSAVLGLLRGSGAFDADITAAALGSVPGQRFLAVTALPVQLSAVIPESLPLALRVQSAGAPVVSLRDGKATARVAASITVLAQRPGSPPQPLFTLDA